MKPLTEEFLLYVSCIPEDKPLILFLDSLDQLDSADGGRQLDWLPKQLPPSVKIILSTLPQEQYICFSRCKVSQLAKVTKFRVNVENIILCNMTFSNLCGA